MFGFIKRWLLKEIAKENAAQWQAIWDLRGALLICKEHGFKVSIKEINVPGKRFFNSLENKEVGVRKLAGYSFQVDGETVNTHFEDIPQMVGKPVCKIIQEWEDIELSESLRK